MSDKNYNWISHIEWFVLFITIMAMFISVNSRFDAFIVAWHEEAKDFHDRLCKIEEKNK